MKKASSTATTKKVAKATKKTVAKTTTTRRTVARAVKNDIVNRNRNYRSLLAELKLNLKDCISLKTRSYISRFGEESNWVVFTYQNGEREMGIPKTKESESLIGSFLGGQGGFSPKR